MDDIELFDIIRQVRTESSETYVVVEDGEDLARFDVHYTPGVAYASLFLFKVLSEERIQDLLTALDRQVVESVLPAHDRIDFFVAIYHGKLIATQSDPTPEDEFERENGN